MSSIYEINFTNLSGKDDKYYKFTILSLRRSFNYIKSTDVLLVRKELAPILQVYQRIKNTM